MYAKNCERTVSMFPGTCHCGSRSYSANHAKGTVDRAQVQVLNVAPGLFRGQLTYCWARHRSVGRRLSVFGAKTTEHPTGLQDTVLENKEEPICTGSAPDEFDEDEEEEVLNEAGVGDVDEEDYECEESDNDEDDEFDLEAEYQKRLQSGTIPFRKAPAFNNSQLKKENENTENRPQPADPDNPTFDEVVVDDKWYEEMGISEDDRLDQRDSFATDADPEGIDATNLDTFFETSAAIPSYLRTELENRRVFGPEAVLLAGFQIEELAMVRIVLDSAGGQAVKVVPILKEVLYMPAAAAVQLPEPDWEQPRPEEWDTGGGWGSVRTLLFSGISVKAQATVVELLEETGLPPVCAAAVDEDNMHRMVGEILAQAVKYQRGRIIPRFDPWEDVMEDELPPVEKVIGDRIEEIAKDLHAGNIDNIFIKEGPPAGDPQHSGQDEMDAPADILDTLLSRVTQELETPSETRIPNLPGSLAATPDDTPQSPPGAEARDGEAGLGVNTGVGRGQGPTDRSTGVADVSGVGVSDDASAADSAHAPGSGGNGGPGSGSMPGTTGQEMAGGDAGSFGGLSEGDVAVSRHEEGVGAGVYGGLEDGPLPTVQGLSGTWNGGGSSGPDVSSTSDAGRGIHASAGASANDSGIGAGRVFVSGINGMRVAPASDGARGAGEGAQGAREAKGADTVRAEARHVGGAGHASGAENDGSDALTGDVRRGTDAAEGADALTGDEDTWQEAMFDDADDDDGSSRASQLADEGMLDLIDAIVGEQKALTLGELVGKLGTVSETARRVSEEEEEEEEKSRRSADVLQEAAEQLPQPPAQEAAEQLSQPPADPSKSIRDMIHAALRQGLGAEDIKAMVDEAAGQLLGSVPASRSPNPLPAMPESTAPAVAAVPLMLPRGSYDARGPARVAGAPDPAAPAQVMSHKQLVASAQRRGVPLEELLEDVRRRGIQLADD